eukprot:5679710-Alexandrium_andersonii.AAC.1
MQLIAKVLLEPRYSLPHGVIQLLGLQRLAKSHLQVAPCGGPPRRPNWELQLERARELQGPH